MAQLTVIFDDHGEEALSLKSTISFATQVAEAEGFEAVGFSGLSEAVYLRRPGSDAKLRIAAHGGERDGVVSTALFPQERRLVDGDYMPVVPLSPSVAFRTIKDAIAQYDAQVIQ